MYRKLVKIFIVSIFFFLFSASPIEAREYKTSYVVDYFVSGLNQEIETRVSYEIKVSHLRSDVYVKKYSLIFPSSFKIKDIAAKDEKGIVQPKVKTSAEDISLDLEFNNPNIGKDSENVMQLSFVQDNLFRKSGNIWETMLPIVNDEYSDYVVRLHLPDTEKKISIAKPVPENIINEKDTNSRTIVWKNPTTKTIYAVFGDKQVYNADLSYHLENPKIIPVYTDVAFPPDNLYQKIFISDIKPRPDKVFIDEDGNYMGRYYLKPKEKKSVVFKAYIELFTKPREALVKETTRSVEKQTKYLLTENKYWKLSSPAQFANLKTPKMIYDFVVDKLNYNFDRAANNISRLGAEKALLNPTNAVCVEFTDLFIAIARENGVMTREIEGYGFSSDQRLRPISLVSDVLHAWPEYYDPSVKLWIPIDPTWEKTSGIDYFSSFDFNHIAFAIHGKRPDYPLPAGTYKLENSKDLTIKPVDYTPLESKKLIIKKGKISSEIHDSQKSEVKVEVENVGNTFVRDIPISAYGNGLTTKASASYISSLAPYETTEVLVYYSPEKQKRSIKTSLIIQVGELTSKNPITITPLYYLLTVKTAVALSIVTAIIFIAKRLKKSRNKDEITQNASQA